MQLRLLRGQREHEEVVIDLPARLENAQNLRSFVATKNLDESTSKIGPERAAHYDNID